VSGGQAQPPLRDTPPLSDQAEQWPVVASEDLHRDDWVIALRADRVLAPGGVGEPHRRLTLEHPGAVIVLAADADDRVLCLWQYRHPAQRRFVELPAGLLDGDDEDPLDVAQRELREEAALSAEDWTHLTSVYSSPGISSEVMHLYLARGISEADRGDFVLEHEEADMQQAWVPFADLHDAVLAGAVTDAPLVACVLLVRARGLI
jgi:8-oxo-dGTP pyrophosphatase MutT (NUDIX family)